MQLASSFSELTFYAGDGLIQLHDLRSVLRACTEENKMNFSDEQLDQLALALYEDAVNSVDDGNISAVNGLEFEHLKAQLEKHPGLIDELSFRYIPLMVAALHSLPPINYISHVIILFKAWRGFCFHRQFRE